MKGSNSSTPISAAVQARADIDDDGSRSSFGNDFEHRNILESEKLLYDSAKQIVEYEWPEKSGEFHFIEEYLANYLGIKNMRRAYPKVERRNVSDMLEKYHLRLNMMVNNLQCYLGVIAIPSRQVWEIVVPDHKEKFEAYRHVKQVRRYGAMVETMQKKSLTNSCPESPEQLKMNSLRACAEWNAGLRNQLPRRGSAKQSEYKRVCPSGDQSAPASKMGYFPVAVLAGQYIDNPRRYSSEELKHYPLNTVLRGPPISARSRRTPASSKNKKSGQKHLPLKTKRLPHKAQGKPIKYLDASAVHDAVVFCSTIPSLPSGSPFSTVPEDCSSRYDGDVSNDSNGSSLFELVIVDRPNSKKIVNVEV